MSVASDAAALDAIAVRETSGGGLAGRPQPCGPIGSLRDGTCANTRWYNLCSGYVWIFASSIAGGEGVGTLFGGAAQPCIAPGNTVRRAITYFRNTYPGYKWGVDVYLDRDDDADGCPDGVIAHALLDEPGTRWNCTNFGVAIPAGVNHVIVRTVRAICGAPTWATDGPFTETCDPIVNDHSFYYGRFESACIPWRQISPTERGDNFLYHLIVDGEVTAVRTTTWGAVKGLFR